MKVLITGAAGFLGRVLTKRLAPEHHLTLADLRWFESDAGACRLLDVTDLDAVREAAREQDAVVHTVALVRGRESSSLRAYAETMVLGTWTVAEACALEGVGRVINLSSVVADGFTEDWSRQQQVGDPPAFTSEDRFYAIAKHLGEAVVRIYGEAFPILSLNIRPGVIAGDGANPGPELPEGEVPPYWFLYVDPRDVADGIAKALASDVTGTYQLMAGRDDTRWEWQSAARDFGYNPQHNWPELG